MKNEVRSTAMMVIGLLSYFFGLALAWYWYGWRLPIVLLIIVSTIMTDVNNTRNRHGY